MIMLTRFSERIFNPMRYTGPHYTKFSSVFSDFYFSSYGHFLVILWCHHTNFRWIFQDNSKNKKNWKLFLFQFSFYSAHSASSIKTGSQLRGRGGGLHILSWEKPHFWCKSFSKFKFSWFFFNVLKKIRYISYICFRKTSWLLWR